MTSATDQFTQPTTGSANPDNAAYTSDGRPDQYGRYRVPHPSSGRVMPWTRATTFAKTISDTYTLNMWGRRMTTVGLAMRPDLLELARGKDVTADRDTLNDVAERAAEAAGSKGAANVGTAVHGFTEQVDRGEEPFIPAPWDRDVAAYTATLAAEGITIVPGMIEQLIVCTAYQVAGTFDRVVDDPRRPCAECGRTVKIGDVKTGRTLDYGWLEIAVQLAVYGNADAIWDKESRAYHRMPEVCRHTAVVMHLPVGEAKCTLYDLDIAAGWRIAELCQQVRVARKTKGLAAARTSAVAVSAEVPAGVGVGAPSWESRVDAARTQEELSELWSSGVRLGAWTDALTQRGLRRLQQIKAG